MGGEDWIGGEFFFEDFVGIFDHGTEFIHFEEFAIFANAFLGVKKRAEITSSEESETDDGGERDERNTAEQAEDDIEETFKNEIGGGL